jgi:hypothetical protein
MSYLGATSTPGIFRSDYFSGDGSTRVFTLSYGTGNESSLIVSISGVVQAAYTYSLSNGTITFDAAPPVGSNNIEIRYLGERVIVPPVLSADTFGIIRINSNIISENTVIPMGYNGSSTGPLQIASGKKVTVTSGSTWKII